MDVPAAAFAHSQGQLLPEPIRTLSSLPGAGTGASVGLLELVEERRAEAFSDPRSLNFPHSLPTQTQHYRVVKRAFDVMVSLLLLPLLGVLLLVIAIVVALTTGMPVFYRQHRLGQYGKTFRIFKFRTMRNNADQALDEFFLHHPERRLEWQQTQKMKQDPRITKLGRFLRDTSLDELPQIINVLCGEMSLVGPRPIVQAERAKYAERFAYYTAAVPGVTGIWQVSGRCNVSYQDRVLMDEDYVRNWSPKRDIYILLRTPRSVIRRDGAC